jgi:hypothetical protein
MVVRNDAGDVIGLVDFAAHEEANGEHTDVWVVAGAAGSKVWPEFLGMRAHDFRVELDGPPGRKHIVALVHKASGHRRERAAVEAAIQRRILAQRGLSVFAPSARPADLRDLVGGPDRPLNLDADGRSVTPPKRTSRPALPLVGIRR